MLEKLPPDKDRRRKLTPEQREEIRTNAAGTSKRALALQYGISRRLVDFIQNPHKLDANKQLREERGGWRQYYDKNQHREAVQDTRQHRRALGLKNKPQKGNSTT